MKKTTLVIGASLNPNRYAHRAINKLTINGFNVFAIGKKEGKVSTVNIVTEKLNFSEIHTVTLYINPKIQKEYYQYIINLKPKRVIFNPGTENAELMQLLKENDIYFEEACTLVLLATGGY